jgi:23S rRNA (guanosine2251-2'-O)-methyltransferase
MDSALILHNIRSVHNVGSVFRTADGAGVSKIILSGYSPAPIDQFGNARQDFAKVSLGAEKTVPWEHAATFEEAVQKLKSAGYRIVALEQDARAVSVFEYAPTHPKLALVLGNEVGGITPEHLALCDDVVDIPMYGTKESLNVSVAAGIAMFALLAPVRRRDRLS